MKLNKKTKIVATLGPSCSKKSIIKQMIKNGVNVFRINFSHASHQEIIEQINLIRSLSEESNANISILADLQGPKLRIGIVKENSTVKKGDILEFLTENPFEGDSSKVYMTYSKFPKDVKKDEIVLLDDGKLIFKVISSDKKNRVVTQVIQGGVLKSKKGVNLPNTKISLPALTKKDVLDATFAIKQKVDWIALSFVRNEKDLIDLKKLIDSHSKHKIPIIAKIEKPEAIKNIDSIIKNCDGLMVARGDLGVELPIEAVPPVQKRLVMKCREKGKPVIVATQMMESMIKSSIPTRAEVSDVAQAIYDGVDAVMLSAETAIGIHPEKVVSTVDKIAIEIERDALYFESLEASRTTSKQGVSNAITVAAREVAETVKVKVICCFTHGGTTASLASRERPRVPIIALTPNIMTARRLTLFWGLHCVITTSVDRFKQAVINALKEAKKFEFADGNDLIIVIAGVPFNTPGTTNILRVVSMSENFEDFY